MVRQPETRYAEGPEGNIAYQVVGDGPMDLVVVPGWFSHVDMLWGDPGWARFVGEFASFARVILYDKRGTGLSDPVDGVPTLESRVDSEGGPISVLFAASYPERVSALILYGTYANGSLVPWGSLVGDFCTSVSSFQAAGLRRARPM
jgi:pimeloyl-ACP methyl ester carboxylesterase